MELLVIRVTSQDTATFKSNDKPRMHATMSGHSTTDAGSNFCILRPSIGLSHVNFTLGIDSQRVGVGHFARLIAGATAAGEDLAISASV